MSERTFGHDRQVVHFSNIYAGKLLPVLPGRPDQKQELISQQQVKANQTNQEPIPAGPAVDTSALRFRLDCIRCRVPRISHRV
jgi:hypothetical protein